MTRHLDHAYRINDVLAIIHADISADLRAATLAKKAAYSEAHLHRLFKKVTGEAIHHYVRRARLEAAANQLIFSPSLTVQQVCESCGFASLSSFTRAFKACYEVTPGEWRSGKKYDGSHFFLSDPDINAAYQRLASVPLPEPELVQLKSQKVAYIRHKGYGRSIRKPWEIMRAWAISENRSMNIQIGLHHSNPALVPLDECRYVVCIGIDKAITPRGLINSAEIPGGLHAAFHLQGRYGELLPYISKMLEDWLPQSGYVAKTTPAFAVYQKNQYLDKDDLFELTFYMPVTPKWLP